MESIKVFDKYVHLPALGETEVGEIFRLFQKHETREKVEAEFCKEGRSINHFRSAFSMLTDWLVKNVLSSPMHGTTTAQQREFRGIKWWAAAKIMIKRDGKKEGIRIAKLALKVAEHYDLENALSISRALEMYYSTLQPALPAKLAIHTDRVKHFKEELIREVEIESIYNRVNYAVQKRYDITDLAKQLERYKPAEYWRYNYLYYLSNALVFQYTNQPEKVVSFSSEALKCMDNYKVPLPYITRFSFHLQLIPLYISTGQYHRAESEINNALALPVYGSYNWHMVLFMKAVLGFHSGKIKMAWQAWHMATKNLNNIHQSIVERWRIVHANLHVFDKYGKLEMGKQFKPARFLNSVEISSQDKGGLNVAVKTAYFLNLLLAIKNASISYKSGLKRRYMDEAEKLPSYISRNNRGRDLRVLKILYAVEDADFRKVRFYKRIEKIKLDMERRTDFYEREMIPLKKVMEIIDYCIW